MNEGRSVIILNGVKDSRYFGLASINWFALGMLREEVYRNVLIFAYLH